MNETTNNPPRDILSYRPSAFYFRRDLRESKSVSAAVAMALGIAREFELLRTWAGRHGVLPDLNVHLSVEILRDAIRLTTSHAQAIMLGLFLCHELEQLRATVREAGFIPPKWIVAPAEAEDKGWELHDDAVNQ